jgi:hypothetical protein
MFGLDQFSHNFWENAVAGLSWDLVDWIPKLPVTKKIKQSKEILLSGA